MDGLLQRITLSLLLTIKMSSCNISEAPVDLLTPSSTSNYEAESNDTCVNDTCIEEYIRYMFEYIIPEWYEWIFILLHAIVFIMGLVGNLITVYAVFKNHSMRTVTNYFIVNLALADLLVILTCLPFTIIWDVTETWFFGLWMCKFVLYFQNVSVAVSVATLVYISLDRYYAVLSPLKFKSTTSRAKTVICIIWIGALVLDLLELWAYETYSIVDNPLVRERTILFTQCGPAEWSLKTQYNIALCKFIFLFVGPLFFMGYTYINIARVLWSTEIPGHNPNANDLSSQASMGNTDNQIRSRRKAAKMLFAVIFLFGLCCFPVHIFSLYRFSYNPKTTLTGKIISCLVHLIFYANSAINPIIYNFMSGKFRKEFKRLFADCWCCRSSDSRNRSVYQAAGYKSRNLQSVRSTSCNNSTIPTRFALTIFSNNNNNNTLRHSTEIVPLSGVCNSPSGYQQQSMVNNSETFQ